MQTPHGLHGRRSTLAAAVILAFASRNASCGEEPSTTPSPAIELTLLDDDAIGFATFQSHNQKVVSNEHGIFLTYLHKSNEDYTAQQWRLARSTDGGRTFSTIHEATHGTSAPAIETDARGRLYLGRPDFIDGNAYLHRLDPAQPRQPQDVTTLPGGSAGKYCLLLDEPRGQLCYFAHNGRFFTVALDGTLRSNVELLSHGPDAWLQYPHLTLGYDGTLFAAWTTSDRNSYLYPSIHAMQSADGGVTWKSLDGTPLPLPVVADVNGPATQISRDDELDVHSWLSAFMAKDGKLHFAYWAKTSPQRQRYLRYDGATGEKEIDIEPIFAMHSMSEPNDSGVFVARRSVPNSPLYFVSTVDDRKRLACLVSRDNGQTWSEYAVSDRAFPSRVYSIGAARDVTADGAIVGTFTNVLDDAESYYEDHSGSVWFFRIPAMTDETSTNPGECQ